MPTNENEVMVLAEEIREMQRVVDGIERCKKKLADNPSADLRTELLTNLYPLLKQLTQAMGGRFQATEEQVVELIERVDQMDGDVSLLTYEDGAALAGVVTLAKGLCQAFREGRSSTEIGEMIEKLEPGCDEALSLINELTVVPEEDEETVQ